MMFINQFMAGCFIVTIIIHQTQSTTENQGINPMVLCAPLYDNYLHDRKPSFILRQTLIISSCLTS